MNNSEYKLSDLSARRPSDSMTDAEWQNYFHFIRSKTEPSMTNVMIKHIGSSNQERTLSDFKPLHRRNTQYDEYCDFINDMLKTLRSGHADYCYYIFQISDLLKYEYDHLRTEYLPDEKCFKVWLDS